jgi:predicted N-acetyltransferase YhbS
VSDIRLARPDEAPALARLINDAFVVENFFKIGDRTSADELLELMRKGGEFLVLESASDRTVVGCLFLRCGADRAYFGMLAVEPARQGEGLGARLVGAAESRARDMGCRFMDIHIVNLREELPPYYRRLGYVEAGTLPFSDPLRASRPCHFVVMSKPIAGQSKSVT